MCNAETVLYQLTETSDFMMSFVIVTREDRVILIDGGRPEDMPLLKQYVGERTVAAWILTHAHTDHISGFLSEYARQDGPAFTAIFRPTSRTGRMWRTGIISAAKWTSACRSTCGCCRNFRKR